MSSLSHDPVIAPLDVIPTIRRHLIGDGFPIVFDFEKSQGSWVHDALSGDRFVDFYTFFASLPVGFRHPEFEEPENLRRLTEAAVYKPSNSDAHSEPLARFVDAFGREALPPGFEHLFFIEGGALAVENALKAAFDWKVRQNIAAGRGEIGTRVLHFREAFHGRSGYTLSLTNTLPVKTQYFPKFDWPRVLNPKLRFPVGEEEERRVLRAEEESLAEIEAAFADHPHEIAAIIIEPIQGEGGDNHFRPEFLQALRRVADVHEALYIVDEIQTGFGITGTLWSFEQMGFVPDIVCFGKKTQVCGIFAGPRIDTVEDNVFRVSSRINSTWGGGLVDMVRCEIILDVIRRDNLLENARRMGEHLISGIRELEKRHPRVISNVRGRGLFCALDCPDRSTRDRLIAGGRENRVLVLPSGTQTVRFRPALTIAREDIDAGLDRLDASLAKL